MSSCLVPKSFGFGLAFVIAFEIGGGSSVGYRCAQIALDLFEVSGWVSMC